MIRFVCPRCKAVLEQPDNAAGTTFVCFSCGQRLQMPFIHERTTPVDPGAKNLPSLAIPAVQVPPIPPPPVPAIGPSPSSTATPQPSLAPQPRSRRDPEDGAEDEYFPSIARRSPGRGRYSQQAAAKAASSGLVCSLVSLAMLLLSLILWGVIVQRPGGRFAGQGEFVVVILFVILGSFVLSLLGIVFSSRGLDESNSYNRGQASAGLVCGILAMLIGAVVGLFFFCAGIFIWSRIH